MKRLGALVVAMSLAGTLLIAAPAKAFYPEPGELFFRLLSGDWYYFFTLGYSDVPRAAGEDPMKDCATGAPVEIERKKDGVWKVVMGGKTNDKGKFRKKMDPAKSGKYRAHILAYTTPDGVECYEGYGAPKRFDP